MQRLSKDTTVFMMCDEQERFRDVIYKFNAVALGARRMARGAGVLGRRATLIDRHGVGAVHMYTCTYTLVFQDAAIYYFSDVGSTNSLLLCLFDESIAFELNDEPRAGRWSVGGKWASWTPFRCVISDRSVSSSRRDSSPTLATLDPWRLMRRLRANLPAADWVRAKSCSAVLCSAAPCGDVGHQAIII